AAAPDLRVFAIAPASAALLQEVGAWPAVLAARVQPYRHMQVWDAAAGAALQFDAGSQGMAALGWIAEQSLLQHALWSALQHQANVVRYCPDAVEGLEQREGGVTLLLASGRRVRADV